MAGFPGKVPYWVGRAMLELRHSIAWYEAKLLPELETWRQQAASAQGDKSLLCDKVLNHIIPYLITVMVQDGIYFAPQFPDHETSKLLIVSTTFYLCSLEIKTCTHYVFLLFATLLYYRMRSQVI
jgi:hypothetical protein